MKATERAFYTSENGDVWLLVRDSDGAMSVTHRPNVASGGVGHTIELGAFLMNERHTAQNRVLQALIATLLDQSPESEAEFLKSIRSPE